MVGLIRNVTLLAILMVGMLDAGYALAISESVDEVGSSQIATSVVKISGAGRYCSGVLVAADWVLSMAGCADRWSSRTDLRLRDADIRDPNATAVFENGDTSDRIRFDRVIRVDGAKYKKNSIVLFHLKRSAPEWSRPVPLWKKGVRHGDRVEIFGYGGTAIYPSHKERRGGLTKYDGTDWYDNGKFFAHKLVQNPSIARDDDYGGPAFVTVRGKKYLFGVIWKKDDRWRCPGDPMTCRWQLPVTYVAAIHDVDDKDGHSNPVGSLIEQIIHPSAALQDGVYEIRSVHSDKCLDVPHSSSQDLVRIIQFNCTNAKNQQWMFTKMGDYYKISAVHSGKCLDVHQKSPENGGQIIQNLCRERQDNQRWWLKSAAGGTYEIRAKHSGKCIDVPSSSTANEVQIIQYQCTGAGNQRWKLTYRGGVPKRKIRQLPKLVPKS